MATTILDTVYRKSHFAAPRGRGGWIFAPEGKQNLGWDDAMFTVYGSCTYTEAKVQLRNRVAMLRAAGENPPSTWYVMP